MSGFPASGETVVGLWPVDDDWDELTVTWNTRPISSGAPLSTLASMPPANQPLTFPSTLYVNSQRPANGGDGRASFITGFAVCPHLTAPVVRNPSKDSPLNEPPLLNTAAEVPTSTELSGFEAGQTSLPIGWDGLAGLALCAAILLAGAQVRRRRA
jgi:hypothetical protein